MTQASQPPIITIENRPELNASRCVLAEQGIPEDHQLMVALGAIIDNHGWDTDFEPLTIEGPEAQLLLGALVAKAEEKAEDTEKETWLNRQAAYMLTGKSAIFLATLGSGSLDKIDTWRAEEEARIAAEKAIVAEEERVRKQFATTVRIPLPRIRRVPKPRPVDLNAETQEVSVAA